MLTQEAVSRVVSASPSIPNQREALLTAVKEAVQTDPNSLHTFANVLCTISTNVSLGQTILDDISEYDNDNVVTVSYVKCQGNFNLIFLITLICVGGSVSIIIMCKHESNNYLGKYYPTPEVGIVPETNDVVPQGNNC